MEACLEVDSRSQVVHPDVLLLSLHRGGSKGTVPPALEAEEYSDHDPVLVHEGEDGLLYVIDGWRRVLFARAKNIIAVEVISLGQVSEAEALKFLLRTGLTHVDRDPFETLDQILALRKLRPDLDSTRKLEIVVGIKHSRIAEILKLDTVAPSTRGQFEAGRIKSTELDTLARVRDPEAQGALATRLADGEIGWNAVREAVATATGKAKPTKGKKTKVKPEKVFDRDLELVLAQIRDLRRTATPPQQIRIASRLRAEVESIEKKADAREAR